MTSRVVALGADTALEAVDIVRSYAAFTPQNDPYGEHDFGEFDIKGHKLNWQIDYFNQQTLLHDRSPSAQSITRRELTIYLASEY